MTGTTGDFASVPEALALAIQAISDGSRTLAMSAAVYPREGDVKELEKRAAAVRTLRLLLEEERLSGGTHNHAWLSDGPPRDDTLCHHGCGLRYGDWKASLSGSVTPPGDDGLPTQEAEDHGTVAQ